MILTDANPVPVVFASGITAIFAVVLGFAEAPPPGISSEGLVWGGSAVAFAGALYPSLKLYFEWRDRQEKTRQDAEDRREKERLALMERIAVVQKEASQATTEARVQQAVFQTEITGAVESLTQALRDLMDDLRGSSTFNPRRQRPSREKPNDGKPAA